MKGHHDVIRSAHRRNDCSMALVSVVIPAHNRGDTLSRAIDSVKAQTWSDVQIIVVDDGSTDTTMQVVEQHARRDSRVCLVRHPYRRGAQAARNSGIRIAAGEWIAFLDSDDALLPNSLEVRLQRASDTGAHIAHSDCQVLWPQAAESQPLGVPAVQGWIYRELLRQPGPVFPALLVRKAALARIGYLDEKIVSFQEWDTAIRLARYYAFTWVPTPTFTYDRRRDDSISRNLLVTATGYEQIFRKHRWPILRYLGPKALASHHQRAAELYRAAGAEDTARRHAQLAFALWPFRPKVILRRVRNMLEPMVGG